MDNSATTGLRNKRKITYGYQRIAQTKDLEEKGFIGAFMSKLRRFKSICKKTINCCKKKKEVKTGSIELGYSEKKLLYKQPLSKRGKKT